MPPGRHPSHAAMTADPTHLPGDIAETLSVDERGRAMAPTGGVPHDGDTGVRQVAADPHADVAAVLARARHSMQP